MLYPSRGPRLEACPDTFQQRSSPSRPITLRGDGAACPASIDRVSWRERSRSTRGAC